jgi:ABC-2 type transport system permease protein
MCNALHALPLRRECWFSTNVISGLAFAIVPNLVMTLIAIPLCASSIVTDGWQVPLYWLLGSCLQFITFFGIAVFSIFCAGSKFASLVVYGILNFLSVLVYVLAAAVYTPMLYGVHTGETPFLNVCPVVQMMEKGYIHTEQLWAETYPSQLMGGMFTVTDHWASLWIYAAVGVMLIAVALLMYRKRHLETAGDFIAVKPLRPVFLIIYTLCAGVAFFVFQELFLGGPLTYFWLYIGLAVGFFTGLMLLERTVRVFRKKNFALCGGLMLIFSLTLVATAMDIFGIESWMPEKSEIKSVTVCDRHIYSAVNYRDNLSGVVLEGDQIDTGLQLHKLALKEQKYFDDTVIGSGYYAIDDMLIDYEGGASRNAVSFTLVYELTDGRRVALYYYGFAETEIGEILIPMFSRMEMVLSFPASEIPDFATRIEEIMLDGELVTEMLDAQQWQALLEAIAADCEEGTMAQNWAFHRTEEDPVYYLEFQYQERDIYSNWKTITVFPECRHTRGFLEESGLLDYLESMDSHKYG